LIIIEDDVSMLPFMMAAASRMQLAARGSRRLALHPVFRGASRHDLDVATDRASNHCS
jgi:hypothetical protein